MTGDTEEMIRDFIKATNVTPLVHVKEAGVITMYEYLKSFLSYKDGYCKVKEL